MIRTNHRAGALRHRVTLQKPAGAATRSATGADITPFADVLTNLPAAVEPIAGRESFSALQLSAESTLRVTLRWSESLAAIAPGWRLGWKPPGQTTMHYLDIQMVINAEMRNRWLELLCREMV